MGAALSASVPFAPTVWPGPMEGVMHPALIRALGRLELIPCWMTPFFRISENVPRKRFFAEFLAPFQEAGKPVAAQLMGNSPELLARAARIFVELGASEINLNFGCPSGTVVGSGAGGAVLGNPGRLRAILEAVAEAVSPVPATVKLRTGICSPEELESILPLTGAARLYVHFRTVRELYRPAGGRVERLRRAVELAGGNPVIANGDIETAGDARELIAATGAAGVMCARGLLRDPGLLRRIIGQAAAAPEVLRRELFHAVGPDTLRPGQRIQLCRMLWNRMEPPADSDVLPSE